MKRNLTEPDQEDEINLSGHLKSISYLGLCCWLILVFIVTKLFFNLNPAGAIRTGCNPATYRQDGETVHVNGFGEIMASLARMGFFDCEVRPSLTNKDKLTTYRTFLYELLELHSSINTDESVKAEKLITERLLALGICKEDEAAIRTAKTIIHWNSAFTRKKITTTGVLRPIVTDVYEPALDILHAYGFNIILKIG
ncbi:hypothetical protein QVD17_06711 [Tagetes erecta]|uniref:Uncharacterized protein n=1 Tax=Tagetes erecta TaxID=13708 RepID=A0AAD8LGH9_TARER|nr:hypothetical protein QVD17_06711 [Tagetes erecta]